MNNWQKRPRLATAVQFNPFIDIPDYVKSANDRYYVININGNAQEIKENDWAILERDGIHYRSCPAAVFFELYEPYSGA